MGSPALKVVIGALGEELSGSSCAHCRQKSRGCQKNQSAAHEVGQVEDRGAGDTTRALEREW